MTRAAVVVAIVLLGGCGDGARDTPPPSRPAAVPEAATAHRACAQARRKILAIHRPQNALDALIDYSDQAADALETVRSPAVKPLRTIDLAAADSWLRRGRELKRMNRAARRLVGVDGDCGEREAKRVVGPLVYAYNLRIALDFDRQRYRMNKRAGGDFATAVRKDAQRADVLARRMKAAPVTAELRKSHGRLMTALRRQAEVYRAAARDPAAVSDAQIDRGWKATNASLKALNRAVERRLRRSSARR